MLAGLLVAAAASGCEQPLLQPDYVARVGDQYYTREDLAGALATLPAEQDTVEASKQLMEQWITNTLLYREALRRGLRNEPEVVRLLRENEQSVLVSSLLNQLYDETPQPPSPEEVKAYFEQHKDALRLREPFIRVRYLSNPNKDSLALARRLLQQSKPAALDSMWNRVVLRFAEDPQGAGDLAAHHYPKSRLFLSFPLVRAELDGLRAGQLSRVVNEGASYHLLQVMELVPEGSAPELAWVQDDLMRRLSILSRKQIYARQVQRLRNEALAREELEVR